MCAIEEVGMSDVPQNFEDPTLKEALRRALGSETAPAGLRQRIAAMASSPVTMASSSDSPLTDASRNTRTRWSMRRVRLAAAAIFLVAMAGLWFAMSRPAHGLGSE